MASAEPGVFPATVLASAPIVTAQSSQVFARNYNGYAAAPLIAAPAHPLLHHAHPVAHPAALLRSPAVLPYGAYRSALPVASPFGYPGYAAAAPLRYSALPGAYPGVFPAPLGYGAALPAPVVF